MLMVSLSVGQLHITTIAAAVSQSTHARGGVLFVCLSTVLFLLLLLLLLLLQYCSYTAPLLPIDVI
jgi:hypothetical protein